MERLTETAHTLDRSSAGAAADVLAAIKHLETVLYPHLRREEEDAMPVVAASITAKDWHTWDQKHNIKPLSFGEFAELGLWTLGGRTRRATR